MGFEYQRNKYGEEEEEEENKTFQIQYHKFD